MNLKLIGRRLDRTLGKRGVLGTLAMAPRVGWNTVRWVLPGMIAGATKSKNHSDWDQRRGIDTKGKIDLTHLDGCGPNWIHGNPYQASRTEVFDALLAAAPMEYERYTFLDLGAGKGRVLVLASEHPFLRIVGVEFSPDLCRIAEQNVSQLGLSKRIEIIHADARDYTLPSGPLAIYLFNPFDETIMQPLIARLEQSLRETPRPIWVLYANAVEAHLWDKSPLFQRVADGRSKDPWVVWQSVGGNR